MGGALETRQIAAHNPSNVGQTPSNLGDRSDMIAEIGVIATDLDGVWPSWQEGTF